MVVLFVESPGVMSYSHTPRCTIDFETRSACALKTHGTWQYSVHPTTEILCLVFRLPYWPDGETALWHPAFPHLRIQEADVNDKLKELFQWILTDGLVEAHNAWFERCMWVNIMAARYGWPVIPASSWRCSAAKAAALSLPRGLEDVINALRLPLKKDIEGAKVMKKLTKPRKMRKAEREAWAKENGRKKVKPPVLYFESKELFERLWEYCRIDVLAEEAVSEALPDLSEAETEMYLLDQVLNERGFCLDPQAINTALTLIDGETKRLNLELEEVTEGKVKKATQRAQMLDWFESKDVLLPDTQGATLDEVLTDDSLVPEVRRGIELVRTLGRASTAKYEAMRKWRGADNRVRGGLLYHGASTGRWTGVGIQPHNFPKGLLKEKDMDLVWEVLNTQDVDIISELYGDVLSALSHGLRGAIVASPGKHLFVADYAAIEARVLLWLAGDKEALGIFERHEDIYCDMASAIYKRPINKKDHPNERQLGKAAVLGCGYQMGAAKFVATAAMYGVEITDAFSKNVVNAYREKFWCVKQLWQDQEDAVQNAMAHPGRMVKMGRVTWVKRDIFLYCILPSGRKIAYPFPKMRTIQTPWGEQKQQLQFMGVDSYTRKWTQQHTYGGSMVENITQAVARDIMAEAIMRCSVSSVYTPLLSVHDELIAEAHPALGDIKEFEALVAQVPEWAKGCPIEAEGWSGYRYHK